MLGNTLGLGCAVNRKELLEAISHLEYLTLNHPDRAKAAAFAQELEEYCRRLRALDEKSIASSVVPAGTERGIG